MCSGSNFIEKPQKVKKQPPAQPSDWRRRMSPEPPNQLEIQLGWSARQDDGLDGEARVAPEAGPPVAAAAASPTT